MEYLIILKNVQRNITYPQKPSEQGVAIKKMKNLEMKNNMSNFKSNLPDDIILNKRYSSIKSDAERKEIGDASRKNWADPKYKKKLSKKLSKTFSTPEMRAVQASKSKPHTKEAKEKIRQANLGLVHSKERVEKNRQQSTGNQRRCKPFMTPSGAFASKKLAEDWATEFGVGNANGKIGKWLKTKPEEFYYISKEEYEKIKDEPKLIDLPWMKKQKRPPPWNAGTKGACVAWNKGLKLK